MNNKTKRLDWKKISSFEYLPLILAFVIVIAFFGITADHFFAMKNFMNILLYTANVGILCCTATLLMVSGNMDLSMGSVMALDGIVLGLCMKAELPIVLCILIMLAVSVLTGVYNAVMITQIKVNPFITTLAGMQIFRGAAYLLSKGKAITLGSDVLKFIGRQYTAGIPNAVILMLILVIVFSLVAKFTTFGRRIYVIGGNQQVAWLSGIAVKRNLTVMFLLHSILCGVCGLVYCAQLGAAMPQNATGFEFDVITAVVLGGTSMAGGKGTIIGSLIGALLIGTLNNGMVMLDVQAYWQDIISGIVLVIAVVFDIIRNKQAKK